MELLEPLPDWTDDERPTIPGSPSTPGHGLAMSLAYLAVGILVSASSGLGNAMVSANLPQIQGALGLTPIQGAWLPAAYVMTNVSANLIVFKVRQQFGIRTFAEWSICIFLAVSLLYLCIRSYEAAVLVRAAAGLAAAPMSALSIFYVLQAFPKARLGQGLCVGLGLTQVWVPIAWLLSPRLLDLGDWQTLYLFDVGLATCALACVIALKLPPGIRIRVFERADFLTYAMLAPAFALVGAVLGLGRVQWWTEQPWMGMALAAALVLFTLAWGFEHNRERPLIRTRWFGTFEMLHFAIGALMLRILLSEQTFAASGLFRQLGMGPDQLQLFYLVVLAGLVTGVAASALTFGPKAFAPQIVFAILLLILGSTLDGDATSLTRPHDMMVSQFLIAMASGVFMAPLMLLGVTKALMKGADHIVTFAIIFGASQGLGGLAGPAIFGTFQQFREHEYSGQITANVVASDPVVAQRLAIQNQIYAPILTDPVQRQGQGMALLSQAATREANVRAYNDEFRLNAIVASLFLLYAHLHIANAARKTRGAAQPSGGGAGTAAV